MRTKTIDKFKLEVAREFCNSEMETIVIDKFINGGTAQEAAKKARIPTGAAVALIDAFTIEYLFQQLLRTKERNKFLKDVSLIIKKFCA